MWNGIINIYKEAGFTSHDVVAKMRGICRMKKIGHTGTLDPDATGVLPVCLGSGTKLCEFLTQKDKEYEAELLLGVVTDTQDTTGNVLCRSQVTVTPEEVQRAAEGFLGDYEQIPPMYSALKVDGKRLYELARAGREVERKARPVVIHEIEVLDMELPRVHLRVVCSKGTYIRTLCSDIGEKLGCGGTMARLERTRSGRFTKENAVTLKELEQLRDQGKLDDLVIPVDEVFALYPALHMKIEFEKLTENGNSFLAENTVEGILYEPESRVRVYNTEGRFYGIYAYDKEKDRYQPVKMFL